METDRWERVQALVNDCLELSAERQRELLHERCPDDPSLRADVESLLSEEASSTGFLRQPSPTESASLGHVRREPATQRSTPVALAIAAAHREDKRKFFQSRLRLYAGWLFVLAAAFFLLITGITLAFGPRSYLTTVAHLSQLAGTLVLGGLWGVTCLRPLSSRVLRWADGITLVVTCTCLAVTGAALAIGDADPVTGRTQALQGSQLAIAGAFFGRVIAVPSTGTRTFWLSLVALVPLMIGGVYTYTSTELRIPSNAEWTGQEATIQAVILLTGWSGFWLVLATLGSHVVFGLRVQVDRAKHLGQYTLEEKIGEGGMGVVYRAGHAMLQRAAAIKLLPPASTTDESLRRFEREVQLTAQLTHPSTVAIYDYGYTPEGGFYYAMEFVDGMDLHTLVRQYGPQPPGRVVRILQQVAGSLSEAHAHGLIHRDIKPANILVSERLDMPDVVKVVDFGLVKSLSAGGRQTDRGSGQAETWVASETATSATSSQVVIGTPAYLAPEAITGAHDVDERSDLYALGAVGYYLLTGQPVFEAATVAEVLDHHRQTTPIAPSVRLGHPLPVDLEVVVMQCLAKQPSERPHSARELSTRLTACATTAPWSPDEARAFWAQWRVNRAKLSGAPPTPTK